MIERNYETEQKVLGMFEELIATLNNILQIHKDFNKEIETELFIKEVKNGND